MLRKSARILFWVIISPLLACLAALAILAVACLRIYQWVALRLYCWRHNRWAFLVCSPRHGWRDFLMNNVIPVVPEPLETLWLAPGRQTAARFPCDAVFRAGWGLNKPYLAEVGLVRVRARSLHRQLLWLKQGAKKNSRSQQLVRELLDFEVYS